jgi:hypothetical protein
MRFIFGLIIGALATVAIYESDRNSLVIESVPEDLKDKALGYSFYENLYNTSVTVLEDAYKNESLGPDEAGPTNYFVQLGSFSAKESADGFRAEVILEGYMTSDISVQSVNGYHRVVIGPFAHKEEAELAMNWATERKFSSLLLDEK